MAHVYVTKQPEVWETGSKQSNKIHNSLYADIFHYSGHRTAVSRQEVNVELFYGIYTYLAVAKIV